MTDAEVYRVLEGSYQGKTLANYRARLDKLREVCLQDENENDVLWLLTHFEVSSARLAAYYSNVNTRKNMVTLLMALLRHSEALRTQVGEASIARWRQLHEDLEAVQRVVAARSEPSEEQAEKYTSFAEIEAKHDEILSKWPDPHATPLASQELVLLSLVRYTRPKRADFHNMRIFIDQDPGLDSANYIVLRSPSTSSPPSSSRPANLARLPSYMVFTRYKTAKVYKRVEEELPGAFVRDLWTSLRRHPRDYLFVNKFGRPLATNNAYSKFVMRTFEKLFGRATGPSLLRHTYISEKLDPTQMSQGELEEEARLMMHSKGMQDRYRWTKPNLERMKTPAAND